MIEQSHCDRESLESLLYRGRLDHLDLCHSRNVRKNKLVRMALQGRCQGRYLQPDCREKAEGDFTVVQNKLRVAGAPLCVKCEGPYSGQGPCTSTSASNTHGLRPTHCGKLFFIVHCMCDLLCGGRGCLLGWLTECVRACPPVNRQ